MKLDEERTQKQLAQLPPGGEEERYFRGLYRLLSELKVPETEVFGFATLLFLDLFNVWLDDGTVVGVHITPETRVFGLGGKSDISEGVAAAFANVNRDPEWWRACALLSADDPEVKLAKATVEAAIRGLPCVVRVQ